MIWSEESRLPYPHETPGGLVDRRLRVREEGDCVCGHARRAHVLYGLSSSHGDSVELVGWLDDDGAWQWASFCDECECPAVDVLELPGAC